MRGRKQSQLAMVHAVCLEDRVPADHPIRGVKALADEVLLSMVASFDAMYGERGRPSVPPERLMKATILMALFSIRSDRQFCEHLEYNMLFRWFLDMGLEERAFDHSTFTRHRRRLIEHDTAHEFLRAVVQRAKLAELVSDEHFTVDGTLIEAWASLKSFRPKDDRRPPSDHDDDKGNPSVNFRGEQRRNDTHESTTDPEAKLARKSNGQTAKLSFAGHVLMENRHGLVVAARASTATGRAEREVAAALIAEELPGTRRITVGADKAYDTREFVETLRTMAATPHVSANTARTGGSAIDGRTTRHEGYASSQVFRKRVEEVFGWMKTVASLRKTRVKGVKKTDFLFQMAAATYDLMRMANIFAYALNTEGPRLR